MYDTQAQHTGSRDSTHWIFGVFEIRSFTAFSSPINHLTMHSFVPKRVGYHIATPMYLTEVPKPRNGRLSTVP